MSIVFLQIIFCFFAAISVTSRRPFVPVEVKFCTKRDGSGGERLNKCGFCSLCDAFRNLPHAVRVTSSNILHICSCRIQIIPFLNGSGQSAQSSVQVTTASGSNHVRCAFSSLLCPPFTCYQAISRHATVLVRKTRTSSSQCELALCRCSYGPCVAAATLHLT